ncbi:diguanylate cyclase [Ferrovibrio sp.]|uniref:sensor domain-containing diguanylate cyclase n=1 Tax=Ferrovibrio sp. TaxID=1917215 RepID=UPI003511F404
MLRVVYDRRILIAVVSALLVFGFLATSLASYYVSRQSLRNAIVVNELPLTSDNIYSEIQKDLIRPVLISSVMSTDTFVRNWVLAGENDPDRMIEYLHDIRERYKAVTSFFVSEKTRIYYHADGILKTVREDEWRDEWYFRVRKLMQPYEINVDPDLANQDVMTIFINYRVRDSNGNFIGVTGIGLTVNAVRHLIDEYQNRFGRTIYFADAVGRIVLKGDRGISEERIDDRGLPARQLQQWTQTGSRTVEVQHAGREYLLNVRFIPELNWYLLVEKDETGVMAGIRNALYVNLLICAVITGIVLLALWLTVTRFQRRLEAMATTDKLTGAATRHAYDILSDQAVRDAGRLRQPLSAVMLDIDRFKDINDSHGHLAGDRILCGVANAMRASLRSSDTICRWGGEEFLVMLRNCDLHNAARIAETIRQTVEQAAFDYNGRAIPVTVSLGVARLLPGQGVDDLVGDADAALYRAKQAGRNCVGTGQTAEAAD